MERLQFHGQVRSGDDELNYGIRDIEALQQGDTFALFTSTGPYGGMVGYQLTGQGGGDTVLLANPWADGLSVYTLSGTQLTQTHSVRDTAATYGHGIRDMEVIEVGGTAYVITSAQGQTTSGWEADETGLTSYELRGNGTLGSRDTLGMPEGDGLLVPTDMTSVSTAGVDYIVLASAQGNSGALSVIQVMSNGSLAVADYVGDTRDTRFGAAQAVDAITVDGRSYVVAGGGDDGVSLFVLAPGGRLVHIDAFADTIESGLNGVTGLALAHDGTHLHVLATSQADAGVTQLRFDISDVGQTRMVSGTTTGSSLDDLLVGSDGTDRINGAGGMTSSSTAKAVTR